MPIDYYEKMESGGVYHVYNRTNNKELAFKEDANYVYFLEKMSKYLPQYLDIWAYCLMPTHFHFLVQVKEGVNSMQVEKQMQLLLMSYAKAINKQYKRHGSLWQKRFRRIEQHDVAWQQKRLCYIHHNPIHHRYESEYDTWRYSSYKSYLSDKASNLVRQPVWDWFAADQAQAKLGFIALHEEYKQDFLWDDYEEE